MQVVGAIIKNSNNEYLLQLRDDKAPSFKNKWTLFGGHVEDQEMPKEALMRGLNEELQLARSAIQSLRHVQSNQHEGGPQQLIFEVLSDTTLNQLVLGEGAAMEYIPEQQLLNREFAFNIEQVLRNYLASNHR